MDLYLWVPAGWDILIHHHSVSRLKYSSHLELFNLESFNFSNENRILNGLMTMIEFMMIKLIHFAKFTEFLLKYIIIN
jgi:hypothetical protein